MNNKVIIIGGGPAGLAVANTLQEAGIDCTVYEKGSLAAAVARFPYYMKWFSTAANLELAGYPLIITEEKPNREEYLNYLRRFAREKKLRVVTEHEVKKVEREGDGFRVTGVDQWGEPFEDHGEYVVLANGAFGQPRTLGIPGEDLPKVSHYFTEVHSYVGKKVAIIGGRSSAAETSLLLYRAGAEVTLIHRGPKMQGLKYWIEPDIENRIKNGEIRAFFNSNVVEIRKREIVVRRDTGELITLENDCVLAMTGYQPDVSFLESIGVQFDPVTKRPKHDPKTLETNVPGIFVAGVITAGNVSGEVFIENSRHHGELIRDAILKRSNV